MFCLYKKKILSFFVVLLTVVSHIIPLFAYEVILGGQSIGIELNYNGVLIKGMYDINSYGENFNQKDYGFKENDVIVQVNDENINCISELSKKIEYCINKDIDIILTLKRDNLYLKKKLNIVKDDNNYTTGFYVKDGILGIGTITYYDQNTKRYGALGHIMSENNNYICQNGSIYFSKITKIVPSKNFNPGEKLGVKDSVNIGTIDKNTHTGIYGTYDYLPDNYKLIETADKKDVKLKEAYFYTVIENNDVIKCKIKIININSYNGNMKNFTFEIIDKNLLNKTNGIIQGMSGSPIVQDGKLIGAVTHVLVNDPSKGYGIFIENMLSTNN